MNAIKSILFTALPAVVLLVMIAAAGHASTRCADPLVLIDTAEAFCCCTTFDGNTCCNYVNVCGTYIPGCFCR